MKKLLAIALSAVLILTLAACASTAAPGGSTPAPGNESTPAPGGGDGDSFELALITDLGTIDDGGFNQGSWEGLVEYANEHSITSKYYQPAAQGDDAYLNAIDLAVQGGAKVIVTPGYMFETPLFVAQDRYPDTKFVLLDGSPNNGDYAGDFQAKVGDNLVSVFYAEEQSGFLAGYAAVMDGYRKLGFMGGISVPAVKRFGHGYIQGAELAAQELSLEDGSVTIDYFYTMTFEPSPDIQTRAAAWYNDGVEVIFACGGGIFFSIAPAAENAGKKVIGVDTDQAGLSDTVITSAMKLLAQSVYDCLDAYYQGAFPGGETLIFAADNDGVGLPMGSSRFESFSDADYEALYAKLVDGSIVVDNNSDIEPDAIPTLAVVVNNLG
jgi:basic membrane protein A